jgi:cold-inducible RNA-binding protein
LELYVGNLPWAVKDDELTSMFAAHGNVVRAKVITDRDTGRSRGFGFVTMGSAEEGNAAIDALNGSDISGRPLTVRVSEERPRGPRPEGRGPRRDFGGGGDRGDRGPRREYGGGGGGRRDY